MRVPVILLVLTIFMPIPVFAEISADFKPGGIIIGPAGDAECVAGTAGALRWNNTDKTHEMCDGAGWKKIIAQAGAGAPPLPPAGSGYFVVTSAQWDGNLGGLSGANAKCLADLTTHDWLGKGDAVANGQLDAGHVRAFLCAGSGTCQSTYPNTTYYFAVSGAPTRGGASFTTDGAGRGPVNNVNWFGTNYFDGLKTYWANRNIDNTPVWSAAASASSVLHCSTYSSASAADRGAIGESSNADGRRWNTGAGVISCDQTHRLICMVHTP